MRVVLTARGRSAARAALYTVALDSRHYRKRRESQSVVLTTGGALNGSFCVLKIWASFSGTGNCILKAFEQASVLS
jgi:hypothetical protein